jgi:hypothetical protein
VQRFGRGHLACDTLQEFPHMTIFTRFVTAAAVLGCAILATAAPAFADEKLPTPTYKARYDAKHDKFCLQLTGAAAQRTGTRLPLIECKTQTQWAAEGLKVARN